MHGRWYPYYTVTRIRYSLNSKLWIIHSFFQSEWPLGLTFRLNSCHYWPKCWPKQWGVVIKRLSTTFNKSNHDEEKHRCPSAAAGIITMLRRRRSRWYQESRTGEFQPARRMVVFTISGMWHPVLRPFSPISHPNRMSVWCCLFQGMDAQGPCDPQLSDCENENDEHVHGLLAASSNEVNHVNSMDPWKQVSLTSC